MALNQRLIKSARSKGKISKRRLIAAERNCVWDPFSFPVDFGWAQIKEELCGNVSKVSFELASGTAEQMQISPTCFSSIH